MHTLQDKILKLSTKHNLAEMSLRQIGKLVSEPSAQKIKHHLLQLEKNGLIQIDRLAKVMVKTRPGSLYRSSLVALPILGTANCGPATTYAEQEIHGYLRVSGKLLTKKREVFSIQTPPSSIKTTNN